MAKMGTWTLEQAVAQIEKAKVESEAKEKFYKAEMEKPGPHKPEDALFAVAAWFAATETMRAYGAVLRTLKLVNK